MKKKRWEFLIDLIKYNRFENVVEVGVDHGHVALPVLRECGRSLKSYTMVDVVFRDSLKEVASYSPAKFMNMHSVDAAKEFEDGSLDLVFIDAAHDYVSVLADINAWLPKIRKGGIICGHDYGDTYEGVTRAVKQCFSNFDLEIDWDIHTCLIAVWHWKQE